MVVVTKDNLTHKNANDSSGRSASDSHLCREDLDERTYSGLSFLPVTKLRATQLKSFSRNEVMLTKSSDSAILEPSSAREILHEAVRNCPSRTVVESVFIEFLLQSTKARHLFQQYLQNSNSSPLQQGQKDAHDVIPLSLESEYDPPSDKICQQNDEDVLKASMLQIFNDIETLHEARVGIDDQSDKISQETDTEVFSAPEFVETALENKDRKGKESSKYALFFSKKMKRKKSLGARDVSEQAEYKKGLWNSSSSRHKKKQQKKKWKDSGTVAKFQLLQSRRRGSNERTQSEANTPGNTHCKSKTLANVNPTNLFGETEGTKQKTRNALIVTRLQMNEKEIKSERLPKSILFPFSSQKAVGSSLRSHNSLDSSITFQTGDEKQKEDDNSRSARSRKEDNESAGRRFHVSSPVKRSASSRPGSPSKAASAKAYDGFGCLPEEAKHLVILQHGLHGNKNDFVRLKIHLLLAFRNKEVYVHATESNTGKYTTTHDGIDFGGARLAKEIESVAAKLPQLQTVSIIAHSLGGLYSRYAIGVLYARRFFEKYEPLNFVTFASPHLGVRRTPNSIVNKVFNTVTSQLFDRTGQQLVLHDVASNQTVSLAEVATTSSPEVTRYERPKNDKTTTGPPLPVSDSERPAVSRSTLSNHDFLEEKPPLAAVMESSFSPLFGIQMKTENEADCGPVQQHYGLDQHRELPDRCSGKVFNWQKAMTTLSEREIIYLEQLLEDYVQSNLSKSIISKFTAKNDFAGKDFVAWAVKASWAQSREEAATLGTQLIRSWKIASLNDSVDSMLDSNSLYRVIERDEMFNSVVDVARFRTVKVASWAEIRRSGVGSGFLSYYCMLAEKLQNSSASAQLEAWKEVDDKLPGNCELLIFASDIALSPHRSFQITHPAYGFLKEGLGAHGATHEKSHDASMTLLELHFGTTLLLMRFSDSIMVHYWVDALQHLGVEVHDDKLSSESGNSGGNTHYADVDERKLSADKAGDQESYPRRHNQEQTGVNLTTSGYHWTASLETLDDEEEYLQSAIETLSLTSSSSNVTRIRERKTLCGSEEPPTLLCLTRGAFLAGLQKFRCRTLYSNVFYDMQVPYVTSAIRAINPYAGEDGLGTPLAAEYPHIIEYCLAHAPVLRQTVDLIQKENEILGLLPDQNSSEASTTSEGDVLDGSEFAVDRPPKTSVATPTQDENFTLKDKSQGDSARESDMMVLSREPNSSPAEHNCQQASQESDRQLESAIVDSTPTKSSRGDNTHANDDVDRPNSSAAAAASLANSAASIGSGGGLNKKVTGLFRTITALGANFHQFNSGGSGNTNNSGMRSPLRDRSRPFPKIDDIGPSDSAPDKYGVIFRDDITVSFENDPDKEILREMQSSLQTLPWRRIDCLFTGIQAHDRIIAKNYRIYRDEDSGIDVVVHLADTMIF